MTKSRKINKHVRNTTRKMKGGFWPFTSSDKSPPTTNTNTPTTSKSLFGRFVPTSRASSSEKLVTADLSQDVEPVTLSQLNFQITRHAFSCNNILDHASHLNKTEKLWDPHLTEYGIKHTLALGQSNNQNYTSNIVFVSCLLRTWETAVLLYLPNILDSSILTIYISPFLKEKHSFMKNGNYPNLTSIYSYNEKFDIDKTINMFIDFLNYLKTTYPSIAYKLNNINILYNGTSYNKLLNYIKIEGKATAPETFRSRNPIISRSVNAAGIKFGGEEKEEEENPTDEEEGEGEGEGEEKTTDEEEKEEVDNNEQINPIILESPSKISIKYSIQDEIGYLYPTTDFKYFTSNNKQNILFFILWIYKNKETLKIDLGSPVHVVAHSNIMQSFIKTLKKIIYNPDSYSLLINEMISNKIVSKNTIKEEFDIKTDECASNIKNTPTQEFRGGKKTKCTTTLTNYGKIINSNSWRIEFNVGFTQTKMNLMFPNNIPIISNGITPQKVDSTKTMESEPLCWKPTNRYKPPYVSMMGSTPEQNFKTPTTTQPLPPPPAKKSMFSSFFGSGGKSVRKRRRTKKTRRTHKRRK